MDTSQPSLKHISKIALAAMGLLLVGAIIFYKERVFFADTSFYVFTVINSKSFCIQYNRYGAFITQLFPLLAQKLNLSVNAILFSYAVSFNLFFLAVACVLYKFRQYGLTILMALYYFLFVSASYFWVNDEIHEAVAFLFLFYGFLFYLGSRRTNMLLLLIPFMLFCFLTISTHFIAIISLVFLWIYFILDKTNWPFSGKTSILLSGAIIVVVIIKNLCTPLLEYDIQHLHGITHVSLRDIINSFRTSVVQMFLHRCLTNYWPGVIVFILGIGSLLKNGKKWLAAWTIASCVGYIVLMGLTYGNLDDNTLLFHIETEWLNLSIIIATPFVFSFLPQLKTSMATCLLAGIFVIRMVYILSFFSPFSARNGQTEQILAQMRKKGITKLALYNDAHLRDVAILDWALPFESILRSSIDGDKTKLTFLFVNPNDTQTLEEIKNPKDFYHAWMMMPNKDLDKKYFNIDTTTSYRVMTYEEFLK